MGLFSSLTKIGQKLLPVAKKISSGVAKGGEILQKVSKKVGQAEHFLDGLFDIAHNVPVVGELTDALRESPEYAGVRGVLDDVRSELEEGEDTANVLSSLRRFGHSGDVNDLRGIYESGKNLYRKGKEVYQRAKELANESFSDREGETISGGFTNESTPVPTTTSAFNSIGVN